MEAPQIARRHYCPIIRPSVYHSEYVFRVVSLWKVDVGPLGHNFDHCIFLFENINHGLFLDLNLVYLCLLCIFGL